MLLPTFARLLAQEQPRVQAALEQAVDRLPASVREVAGYVLLAGGKRLRPLLTLTAARLVRLRTADLYDLAAAPEMIHVASLLHDDVLDAADTRRGRRAAHQVFGVIPCLLAGDALLAEASHRVALFGDPALVLCVSERHGRALWRARRTKSPGNTPLRTAWTNTWRLSKAKRLGCSVPRVAWAHCSPEPRR